MEMPQLKIYKDEEGHDLGYDSKELAKWMKKRQFLKSWTNWSCGTTGAIIDEHFVVYYWDIESFLNGEKNYD